MEQGGQSPSAAQPEWPERLNEGARLVPASRLTMLCRRSAETESPRAEVADNRRLTFGWADKGCLLKPWCSCHNLFRWSRSH